jgi:transposase
VPSSIRLEREDDMSIVTELSDIDNPVAVGVDTHAEVHVAAVIDQVGRELGHRSFPTTPAGHRELHTWIGAHGAVMVAGIEGTGVYGAGLARYLTAGGVHIVEVDRPDRKARRFAGKSDPIDAYAAARAALSGRAAGIPKTRDGNVEMIRVLRVARSSAVKARAVAITQLKAVIKTAPDELRSELRSLGGATLITRCAGLRPNRGPAPTPSRFAKRKPRPGRLDDATAATKRTLASLARRVQRLNDDIADLDDDLDQLVAETAPTLIALFGVATDIGGQLLATVGDNPDRIHSSAAFAHLCGVAPIPASSGKTNRHRLNRGGDRNANCALYRITMCRLRHDPHTRLYRDRLLATGKTNQDAIRILKRAIARQVYQAIKTDLIATPNQT